MKMGAGRKKYGGRGRKNMGPPQEKIWRLQNKKWVPTRKRSDFYEREYPPIGRGSFYVETSERHGLTLLGVGST